MSNDTKQALKAAFVKLLNERAFDKIRVKDVVAECACNRNTFYYYYQDLYALLEELLNEELANAIVDTEHFENWQEGLIAGARFLMENQKGIYHLYNSISREQVEAYINRVVGRTIERYVTAQSADLQIGESDRRLIVSFYVHAIVGMFQEWMDGRMHLDAEAVIRRAGQLLEGNVRIMCERAANSHLTKQAHARTIKNS